MYSSALIFSPSGSLVRKLYAREEPTWIVKKPAVASAWDSCLQTLAGHGSNVDWFANSASVSAYSMNEDGSWVTRAECPLLWLPPGFQPSAHAAATHIIYIGTRTGRIFMIHFADA